MSRAWRVFETDSRSLEISIALVGLSFSLSCAFGRWFGGWLPQAAALSGLEPVFAVLGIAFNGTHLWFITRGHLKARQGFAICNALMMVLLSCVVFAAYGWLLPAGPVLAAGGIINAWVYLSLHSDRVDVAHWSKRR